MPREKLARGFFRPDRQKHYPFRVRLDGVFYRGNFSEYLDWRVFFLGSFERETINLCRFLAPHARFPVFCDMGANKGLFSLMLARSYRKIYALEPYESNIALFSAALKENGLGNVEILPFAMGEEDAVADFYLRRRGTSASAPLSKGM